MDGVLADLTSEVSRRAAELFGGTAETAGQLLTARRRRLLWKHLESVENFWETLEEIEPGGVACLAALAAERRWETIFLTTRPESAGDPAQLQTHRWLAARGFPSPSVFVVRRSRGVIAAALELDAVVDDRAENCVDVVTDSSARAVLVCREAVDVPTAAADRLRIDVVSGLNESLNLLRQIDGGRQPSRSRFASLLQAFVPRAASAG